VANNRGVDSQMWLSACDHPGIGLSLYAIQEPSGKRLVPQAIKALPWHSCTGARRNGCRCASGSVAHNLHNNLHRAHVSYHAQSKKDRDSQVHWHHSICAGKKYLHRVQKSSWRVGAPEMITLHASKRMSYIGQGS